MTLRGPSSLPTHQDLSVAIERSSSVEVRRARKQGLAAGREMGKKFPADVMTYTNAFYIGYTLELG